MFWKVYKNWLELGDLDLIVRDTGSHEMWKNDFSVPYHLNEGGGEGRGGRLKLKFYGHVNIHDGFNWYLDKFWLNTYCLQHVYNTCICLPEILLNAISSD